MKSTAELVVNLKYYPVCVQNQKFERKTQIRTAINVLEESVATTSINNKSENHVNWTNYESYVVNLAQLRSVRSTMTYGWQSQETGEILERVDLIPGTQTIVSRVGQYAQHYSILFVRASFLQTNEEIRVNFYVYPDVGQLTRTQLKRLISVAS